LTLVSTRGPVFFPAIDHATPNGGAPNSETSILLDATAEKCAFIVRAPFTGTLHKVRFRTATVTTGDTLKVSFQDVDLATGDPDGTPDQYRTIVIADANDNASLVTGILSSDGTDNGTKRAVTRGDLLAVVIEFDSFVAGNLNIATRNTVNPPGSSGGHYTDHFTAAWAKNASSLPRLALEYSDGSYWPIPYACPAVGGIAAETYNSGSTPDERGLIFQVPFSCKASGIWGFFDVDGDVDVVLYNSDGTSVMESVSLDATARIAGTAAVTHAQWDSDVTLTKDTNYRLVLKPTSVTNASLFVGEYTTAAVLDSLSGGSECHYTSRTDAGSWTEDDSMRPLMGLILSYLDDGASTGGSGTPVVNRSRLRRLS
jgi:hypothetical protein